MTPANNVNFVSSFPILVYFIYFSCYFILLRILIWYWIELVTAAMLVMFLISGAKGSVILHHVWCFYRIFDRYFIWWKKSFSNLLPLSYISVGFYQMLFLHLLRESYVFSFIFWFVFPLIYWITLIFKS